MIDIRVQAKNDHIESLFRASPLVALEELIWNALDADAREVKIDIITNPLGAVDAIRVTDDGIGVNLSTINDTFGSLGGSWKRTSTSTMTYKRNLHGRHGCGRFKSFALGGHVEWRTASKVADGTIVSWILSGDISEPGIFHAEENASSVSSTGTEVLVTNIRAAADSLSDAGTVVSTLAAKFALYLKNYPNVRIYFSGIPVTPVIVQKSLTKYTVRIPSGEEAKLEIIEWRRKFAGAGRLVFCGGDGFALHDESVSVRMASPFSFTAYMVSPRFDAMNAENALVMDELNPETRSYLDAARKILRDHFRVRVAENDASRVDSWIAEGSYPFAKDDSSALRERFDRTVEEARANLDGFDTWSVAERKYLFSLVRRLAERE